MRSLILLSAVLELTVYGQLVIKARALLHSAAGTDRLSYMFATPNRVSLHSLFSPLPLW